MPLNWFYCNRWGGITRWVLQYCSVWKSGNMHEFSDWDMAVKFNREVHKVHAWMPASLSQVADYSHFTVMSPFTCSTFRLMASYVSVASS